jgi:hypothetical protein
LPTSIPAGSDSGRELLPAPFFALFRPAITEHKTRAGKKKDHAMKSIIQFKTAAAPLLIILALLCFGLSPKVQAVNPPPDGGYPNFNTAEGENALESLTTGSANTAVGWRSLLFNTDASFNTGVGAGTLFFNQANDNTAFGAAALFRTSFGGDNTAVGARPPFSTTQPAASTRPMEHSRLLTT